MCDELSLGKRCVLRLRMEWVKHVLVSSTVSEVRVAPVGTEGATVGQLRFPAASTSIMLHQI